MKRKWEASAPPPHEQTVAAADVNIHESHSEECPVCYETPCPPPSSSSSSSEGEVVVGGSGVGLIQDVACCHKVCESCYARMESCPMCRREYLKLEPKMDAETVFQIQTRKHAVYDEMKELHKKYREKEQEFMDLEDDLRDQVRVRVYEHSRGTALDRSDPLYTLTQGVIDFAEDHERDPNTVWWSTTMYKAIERERDCTHTRRRLRELLQ